MHSFIQVAPNCIQTVPVPAINDKKLRKLQWTAVDPIIISNQSMEALGRQQIKQLWFLYDTHVVYTSKLNNKGHLIQPDSNIYKKKSRYHISLKFDVSKCD